MIHSDPKLRVWISKKPTFDPRMIH